MRNLKHVRWAGILVFGFAISAFAQVRVTRLQEPVDQQAQSLMQLGAGALAVDDAPRAREAFAQLLEIGRKNGRLDVAWQAHDGLGRAALAAHDPLLAIEHLEQSVAGYEQSADKSPTSPYRSLATALMMQSSSPTDQYVERAFHAAARGRAGHPAHLRSRAELAEALRTGDMVVAVMVGDRHAHAWAFDRGTFVGYPLPPPAEIATAVERITVYASQQDRAGVQRIADDLMPALLGPVMDRLSTVKRVIFLMDGPLRKLAIGELPLATLALSGSQRVSVAVVDDGSLFDEIGRPPSNAAQARSRPPMSTLVASAVIVAVLIGAGVAAIRRRSSVP